MNYEEFVDEVIERVESGIEGVYAKRQKVEKPNCEYDGILVGKNNEKRGYVYDPKDIWEDYDGNNFEDLVYAFLNGVRENLDHAPNYEGIYDYKGAKGKLIMQMISAERNEEVLKTMPHRIIGDMAVIYRVDLGGATCAVTDNLMNTFGVNEEQLYEDAVKNQEDMLTFKNMADVMRGFGADVDDSPLWVGSVKNGMYGAVCIVYPEYLMKVSERLGGSYWVLPSSTHEVLFILDNGGFEKKALEGIVRGVNGSEVSVQDFLSDSVYYYDCENEVLRVA